MKALPLAVIVTSQALYSEGGSTRAGLEQAAMLVHIPKTGGTSLRRAMGDEYKRRFQDEYQYTNINCGCKRAPFFHLTLDEMERCNRKPVQGPTLCVVRDPLQRFESEVITFSSFTSIIHI